MIASTTTFWGVSYPAIDSCSSSQGHIGTDEFIGLGIILGRGAKLQGMKPPGDAALSPRRPHQHATRHHAGQRDLSEC